MMEDLSAQLMAIFVPAIVAVAGILVTWGLAELRKLIKTKTDNAAAVQAFDTVADLVQSSVTSVNQTTRKVFEDGKLSEAEKRELKLKAMALVMDQLPAATKKVMDKNLNNLAVYVDNRIEQTVFHEAQGRQITGQNSAQLIDADSV
jgi:hypothetical protein